MTATKGPTHVLTLNPEYYPCFLMCRKVYSTAGISPTCMGTHGGRNKILILIEGARE